MAYGNMENISGLINYSTSERVVGTWIDGKPLYQKTLVSNTATTGSAVLTIGDIENCVFAYVVDGFYVNNRSDFAAIGAMMMLTNTGRDVATTSYTSYVACSPISGNKVRVNIMYGSTTASTKTVATVRYTKTTD